MRGKSFLSFDQSKIYYHVNYGKSDKWVIFLHGLGGDLTAWENERRHFDSLGLNTVAVDLRGHGLSARSTKEDFYAFGNFAKDIELLAQEEKIKSGVLVGHCFGGMVAICLAAQNPEFLKGLVLVDTTYKPPIFGKTVGQTLLRVILRSLAFCAPTLKEKGHAHFEKFVGTSDIDLERIASDIFHTSLQSYLLMCDTLVGYEADTLLKKIKVPTLVICGTNDTIFSPEISEEIKGRIKTSQIELIEGGNHILVLNNPKDLNESIERFLERLHLT